MCDELWMSDVIGLTLQIIDHVSDACLLYVMYQNINDGAYFTFLIIMGIILAVLSIIVTVFNILRCHHNNRFVEYIMAFNGFPGLPLTVIALYAGLQIGFGRAIISSIILDILIAIFRLWLFPCQNTRRDKPDPDSLCCCIVWGILFPVILGVGANRYVYKDVEIQELYVANDRYDYNKELRSRECVKRDTEYGKLRDNIGTYKSVFRIPNDSIDIDCGIGYTLNVISSSENKLHLEMKNCGGLVFTHTKDISNDECYLYDDKYTNSDIINFIEAGLNKAKSNAILNVETKPTTLTLSLDISVDILNIYVNISLLFMKNEITTTQLESMMNKLALELKVLKSYVPITILWDSKKDPRNKESIIPQGWFKIPLNYISLSDPHIVLNSKNHSISVTPGAYEFEAKLDCNGCDGFHIQIRFNNSITIQGSSTYASETHKCGSISFIPRQSIELSNNTSMELWVYTTKQGWSEYSYNISPLSVQNTISLRYSTAISIKKLY